MTQKLFRIKITYNVMVTAEEDECSAWDNAYLQTKDELSYIVTGDNEPDIEVCEELTSLEQLDAEWDEAIPFGFNKGGLTCNEIIELQNESNKEKVIENLTDEQKKEILSKMTLQEICDLLNKND